MYPGLTSLTMNLGPTELPLIVLFALPGLLVALLLAYWLFRMGKRQGAAEARRELRQDSHADST